MPDISIALDDARIQYTATNGQTTFAYDFPITDETHLVVKQTLDSDGTTSTLTLTTEYTVTGEGEESGGNVVLVTGANTDDTITIERDVPEARTTDFTTAGDFFAATLNDELDLQTMMMQQLRRDFDRSLRMSVEDTLDTLNALPSVSDRASMVLGFDASGQPEAVTQTNTTVSSFMATVLDDSTAAAARTTLGLAIGTDVQAYDADLAAIAALASTADRMPYATAAQTWAVTPLTAAARSVLDDATVAAMVDTLGGASATGTGGLARATSPTFVTPTLGVAAATSINFGDEALSNYDEGTFTGGVSFGGGTTGITYNSQSGRYIRVGKLCYFGLAIVMTAKGSSTGAALITGLPFTTVNGSSPSYQVMTKNINLDTAGGFYSTSARPSGAATTLALREIGDNNTYTALTDADFGNDTELYVGGVFEIA